MTLDGVFSRLVRMVVKGNWETPELAGQLLQNDVFKRLPRFCSNTGKDCLNDFPLISCPIVFFLPRHRTHEATWREREKVVSSSPMHLLFQSNESERQLQGAPRLLFPSDRFRYQNSCAIQTRVGLSRFLRSSTERIGLRSPSLSQYPSATTMRFLPVTGLK